MKECFARVFFENQLSREIVKQKSTLNLSSTFASFWFHIPMV